MNKKKLIVLVGPTASGKSDLGIKLAKKINGEIISADSRQIYRDMDIGTGKVGRDAILPSLKPKALSLKPDYYSSGIRHHLLDIADPKKQFSASDFKKLGERAIEDIIAKNKIPVVVGGTGFYIDILLGRMQTAEVKPNKKLRAKLEKQSAEQLFKRLSVLDSEYSGIIDRYNKRRLIRALEIILTTGKPMPKLIPQNQYHILWLGLNPKDLQKKIKTRLNSRLRGGMIKEVKKLRRQGLSWKRLGDFGLEYRWISRYVRGLIPQNKMRENLYRDIIKYSKRQMTWFKKNKEINWINGIKNAEALARRFVD